MIPPAKEELKEVYPWWELPVEVRNVNTSFLFFRQLDDTFFYALDSTLMFMSKGGITLDSLRRLGPRSKGRYLQPLQDIFRAFYGGGKKQDGESDEITPTEM